MMARSQFPTSGLVEFLEERAEDALRTIIYHDQKDFAILYIRDDVLEQYSDEDIEAVIEDLRWNSFEKSHQEGLYVHGELHCTVRCFDEAVQMHILHDELTGIAIGFDPAAARELYSFLGECLTQLRER